MEVEDIVLARADQAIADRLNKQKKCGRKMDGTSSPPHATSAHCPCNCHSGAATTLDSNDTTASPIGLFPPGGRPPPLERRLLKTLVKSTAAQSALLRDELLFLRGLRAEAARHLGLEYEAKSLCLARSLDDADNGEVGCVCARGALCRDGDRRAEVEAAATAARKGDEGEGEAFEELGERGEREAR